MRAPGATQLLAEIYAGNYGRVLETLAALDITVHLDPFLSTHRMGMFIAIQKAALRVYIDKRPIVDNVATCVDDHIRCCVQWLGS